MITKQSMYSENTQNHHLLSTAEDVTEVEKKEIKGKKRETTTTPSVS